MPKYVHLHHSWQAYIGMQHAQNRVFNCSKSLIKVLLISLLLCPIPWLTTLIPGLLHFFVQLVAENEYPPLREARHLLRSAASVSETVGRCGNLPCHAWCCLQSAVWVCQVYEMLYRIRRKGHCWTGELPLYDCGGQASAYVAAS